MSSSQSFAQVHSLRRSRPANALRRLEIGAQDSDRGLVLRARSGERGAFDILVLKYQRSIVDLAMRYLRNRSDAEDAAQEAFIRAYRGLRHFRGDCAFYSWLYRIAVNTAKKLLTSRVHIYGNGHLQVLDVDGMDSFPARLMDWDTPESLALTGEIRRAVHAAIEALAAESRAAITMREYEGCSYDQIAAAMSTPIGTVRSRVFRAREAIDRQLRQVFDGGLGRNWAGR